MSKFKLVQLFGIIKLHYIEWLEDYVNHLRPYAINKEECNGLMEKGLDLIDNANSIPSMIKAKRKIKKTGKKIKTGKNKKVIPVMVVGDLFRILEHEANQHIFEKLGDSEILPYKSFYLSHYYRKGGNIGPWGKKSFKYRRKFAKGYIDKAMAFGTLEAVGDTVRMLKQKRVKGIIHMYNFTCMPEIVNSVIFKKIAKDFNVPLLSLASGEHETVAHQDTRIEAFIDLLRK
jgi:predicted nucleotide-binding protein (sugar kinase/HSP70/actin superfamily)